jgi:hypothetical protein
MVLPGEFIVLASNVAQFNNRYKKSAYGEFKGQLDNAGETITLTHESGQVLSITYDDKTPWPEAADGTGYSIVPKESDPSGDQNNSSNWRASLYIDGSPGRDDEIITGIEAEENHDVPRLYQNFPNPFKENTFIQYEISSRTSVELTVFDMLGREVATLVNQKQQPDLYTISFKPDRFQQGIYIYQLKTSSTTLRNRMILLK